MDREAPMSTFSDFVKAVRDDELCIILGCQGSGTNLLSQILRSVFGFSVVHDRSLIFNAAVEIHQRLNAKEISRQRARVHQRLFPGPLRRRFQFDTKHFFHQSKNYTGIHDYYGQVEIDSPKAFADFYYCYHAWRQSRRYRAIKSDDLWERIEYVRQIFPQRRYVLLVRDPRDNALSIINKPFGPRNIYTASLYVRKRLAAYTQEVEAFPDKSLVVTYETLLEHPDQFVADFSTAFNIAPADDFETKLQSLAIRSENSQKWRRLSKQHLALCEDIFHDELERFGYARVTTASRSNRKGIGHSQFDAILWRTRDMCARVPQRIRAIARNIAHS
jgi:hypothetical protein